MVSRKWFVLILTCMALVLPAIGQTITGYNNPTGFGSTNLSITGTEMAVSADGKLALAQDNSKGGATITVYDKVGLGRTALTTFTAPTGDKFKYISGIAWKDNDTLVFGENGDMKTVYSASLSSNSVARLVSIGSFSNIAQIALRPSDQMIFALLANGPGAGAVATLSNGVVSMYATGLGNGYLSGIAFRSDGALFVGDTNDPNFIGNSGQALRINSQGIVVEALSLAGAGGQGCYDIAFNSEGDLFATTGSNLSLIKNGTATAQAFGSFSGYYPFPTALELYRSNLLVNAQWTDVGGLFEVHPTPEPASLGAALMGAVSLLALRRKAKR